MFGGCAGLEVWHVFDCVCDTGCCASKGGFCLFTNCSAFCATVTLELVYAIVFGSDSVSDAAVDSCEL